MDNRETLKALVELAKKATPGPWKVENHNGIHLRSEVDDVHVAQFWGVINDTPHNADFTATARNAIPELKLLLSRYEKLVEAAKLITTTDAVDDVGQAYREICKILRDIEGE